MNESVTRLIKDKIFGSEPGIESRELRVLVRVLEKELSYLRLSTTERSWAITRGVVDDGQSRHVDVCTGKQVHIFVKILTYCWLLGLP